MDTPYSCVISLADIPLRLRFHFSEAAALFSAFTVETDPVEDLLISDDEWAYMCGRGFSFDAHNEASFLTAFCSDALLPYERCVFHAVAVRFRDRAWLIAAPPGVGKSTQARVLQELWPGEFSVICGDRPVLQLTDDGGVFVHPSPWNGKENWHGADGAPLEGIIFLCRGESDDAYKLRPLDAVLPALNALIQTGISEERILQAAAFTTQLLERVPAYRLQSENVPGSTIILYKKVIEREDSL